MADLIDKQYLTNYLRALLDELKKEETFNYLWIHGIEKAIEIVGRQEVKQRWILVSEQLPDGEGEVLITSIEGTVGMALYYNGKFGVSESYQYAEGDVIAWMPLPKPYER